MREVVCLNVGTKYAHDYETRLYLSLCRQSTMPFNFRVIREERFPGWWNKLLLFPPTVRTIFFDLDVVITANVDAILRYDGPFCIWGDPWNGRWNSSVMSIAPGFGETIRARFLADPDAAMARFYSDQEFIAACLDSADVWQTVAPGLVKSYKADSLECGPNGAAVVTFHGEPKPASYPAPWILEHWR